MSKKTQWNNFNHLSGSQILSPFVTPHVGTCETLTNTFALQYSSIENGFLHKYVVGRWIAKINKVSCSYLHILQCLLALMPIFTGFIFFFFFCEANVNSFNKIKELQICTIWKRFFNFLPGQDEVETLLLIPSALHN